MKRSPNSHKGDNGKVAVIGGSQYQHGAPLFSALATEASGVDLVFVCVPSVHEKVARMQSLNFQVHPFSGTDLTRKDVSAILELLATVDAAVIGPGLARTASALTMLRELIEGVPCPMVLDASALQPWTLQVVTGKSAVLTPHLGELERMEVAPKDIARAAKRHRVTIHLKSRVDRIANPTGKMQEVRGGNAGLTVGGTGDALAGLIAGLMAQGMPSADACVTASRVIKRAGTRLYATHGYAYTTRGVIEQIPHLLRQEP